MSLRIIDSPYYRAAGHRVVHNGSAAISVPAGHVQDLVSIGRVEYVQHPTDALLNDEVSLVWQLGGLAADDAARKTSQMLESIKKGTTA